MSADAILNLIILIVKAETAQEESRKRSERAKAAWKRRREKVA